MPTSPRVGSRSGTKPGDHQSQPSGDVGGRIACAVVARGEATQPAR